MTTTTEDLGTCEWFALCVRPAAGEVPHPILGFVPTCAKCAAKFDLMFVSETITVSEDEFARLQELLDRPARALPRLTALLRKENDMQ